MGCTQGSVQGVSTTGTTKVESMQRRTFFDEYSLGKKLGAGAFAQVRIAIARDSAENDASRNAVKVIDLRADKTEAGGHSAENVNQRLRMDAKCEASIWRRITEAKVAHCIKLEEVFWDTSCCYMVMERCEMTLLYELEHCAELNELYLGKLFAQMAMAMEGLHNVKVVHRDIKPDNFLVNSGCQLKLGDFGLSTIIQDGQPLTE
eukprot:1251854-Amphidinium_carterae.1